MQAKDHGPIYRLSAGIARTSIGLVTRDDWRGQEHLPADGGFLVCVNHISHADPFAVARFLLAAGHPPFFLAKASLFDLPIGGRLMAGAGQIPVHRGSTQAGEAFRAAVQAVEEGRCVVVMPESTITKDPQGWPMTGKSGAARIALTTGRPVIPLAQWGAQFLRHPGRAAELDGSPRARDGRLGRGVRPAAQMLAGAPVPLDDLRARPTDPETVREATDRIMTALTTGVAQLRGRDAPAGRWDPRRGLRVSDEAGGAVAHEAARRQAADADGIRARMATDPAGEPPRHQDPSTTEGAR